jgi:hypothetical protein
MSCFCTGVCRIPHEQREEWIRRQRDTAWAFGKAQERAHEHKQPPIAIIEPLSPIEIESLRTMIRERFPLRDFDK